MRFLKRPAICAAQLLLLCCPGRVASGGAGADPDVDAICAQAQRSLDSRDDEQALRLFSDAIRHDPKCDRAFYGRGRAHARRAEWAEALADFTAALRIRPRFSEALVKRAMVQRELGNNSAAVNDFDQAIRINPRDADAYYYRAFVGGSMGQLAKAREDLDTAIKLRPDNAAFRSTSASMRLKCNDYRGAAVELSEALRLDPNSPSAHFYRGHMYFLLGEYYKALADLTESIRLTEKQNKRDRWVSEVYLDPFEDNSLGENTTLREVMRSPATERYFRAWAYVRSAGKFGSAIEDMRAALQVEPESLILRRGLCWLLMATGEDEEAFKVANEIVRTRPSAEAYYVRALIRARLGRLLLARDDFDAALRLSPANVRILLNRGWTYQRLGQRPQSLRDLDEAIRLDKSCAAAYYFRARVYSEIGAHDKANADTETAKKLEPDQTVWAVWQAITLGNVSRDISYRRHNRVGGVGRFVP
jgi:tetratricopeptide (TPR) repeat protein